MDHWNQYMAQLSRLHWEQLSRAEVGIGSGVLREMADSSSCVVDRFRCIAKDDALYRRHAPHMEYPRPLMDKFVLYMDPDDRFRVRLHKFKPANELRGCVPLIHDHRWPFMSILLKGSYTEVRYEVCTFDDTSATATLREIDRRKLREGEINVGELGVPHLTVNEHAEETCFSLFVRGPSLCSYSRIFDIEAGSFRRSFGLRQELESEVQRFTESIR